MATTYEELYDQIEELIDYLHPYQAMDLVLAPTSGGQSSLTKCIAACKCGYKARREQTGQTAKDKVQKGNGEAEKTKIDGFRS